MRHQQQLPSTMHKRFQIDKLEISSYTSFHAQKKTWQYFSCFVRDVGLGSFHTGMHHKNHTKKLKIINTTTSRHPSKAWQREAGRGAALTRAPPRREVPCSCQRWPFRVHGLLTEHNRQEAESVSQPFVSLQQQQQQHQ